MTTQISLTEKEKEVILEILKNHDIDLVYETRDVERNGELKEEKIYNNVLIFVSEDDKEQWYIQVN